ncbi:enolase C-terminal domain-like protein [Streptomyces sp. NPDC050738]|uniref:enolase C-terminal domain-like protein n=1 Tax=Streptomyces sp. NPDC050738 TaxID=3154744 RepID=UPI003427F76A
MTAPPASGCTSLRTIPVTPRTTWLLARLGSGWGELSDIPADEAGPLLAELSAPLAGLSPDRAVAALEASGTPDTFARRTAAGGLATAAADAAARQAGMELAGWLGERVRLPVRRRALPLYANINRAMTARTPEAAAAVAARALAAGFRTVKCAPFDGLSGPGRVERGLEIALAVRETIGEGRELLLDAHHLLSPEEIVAHASVFTSLRLGWLEDAAPLGDAAGLRRVRDAVGAPIAGGEFAATAAEVLPALRSGALDVLMPDIKHAGGPLQVLRLAALAREHGVAVSLHNPSGPVATAASAHVSALLPDGSPPLETMFGEIAWRASAVAPAEPIAAGTYTLSAEAGIGLTPLDEEERQP